MMVRTDVRTQSASTPLTRLQGMVPRKHAILVDSAMLFVSEIDWTDAIRYLYEDKAYILVNRTDGAIIHTPRSQMTVPLIVALNKYIGSDKTGRSARILRIDCDHTPIGKHTILDRDQYKCQYCGRPGFTVDHIHPRSRGGMLSWNNSCCACFECNSFKGDRTPAEAHMRIPVIVTPAEFLDRTRSHRMQKLVWDAISAAPSD